MNFLPRSSCGGVVISTTLSSQGHYNICDLHRARLADLVRAAYHMRKLPGKLLPNSNIPQYLEFLPFSYPNNFVFIALSGMI